MRYLAAAVLLASTSLLAQTPAPASPEAAGLAQGWAQLNRGEAAAASATGASLLGQFPRSAAVLALAIEADIARVGALAALDTYERWLGARKLDDAYVLRRIARGLLRESGNARPNPARVEALKYLAADGDVDAANELDDLAAKGGDADRFRGHARSNSATSFLTAATIRAIAVSRRPSRAHWQSAIRSCSIFTASMSSARRRASRSEHGWRVMRARSS